MGAAALAVFVLILLVQFPAQWAAHALPGGARCEQLGGTLWSGTCDGLSVQGEDFGSLTWTLHPLRLLTGKLSVDLELMRPAGSARANLSIGLGRSIAARNVHASLPVDHSVIAALPPGVRGTAQADLASLNWNGRRVTAIQGQIDLRGLQRPGVALGDYRLFFPGGSGDEPVGRLTDLGGPLAVQGSVRLTRDPGFELNAQVAARASAPADIIEEIQYLGSPDAQGRRPFSWQGTF